MENINNAVVLSEIDQRLQLFNLDKQNSLDIKDGFENFLAEIDQYSSKAFDLVVSSEDQVEKIEEARQGRLALMKIRTGADKKRKGLKEYSNRYGKAVQDIYNLIEDKIKPAEQHLLAQEKFAENLKKERLEKIQKERVEAISEYVEDAQDRNWAELDDDVWDALLTTKVKAYQDKLAEEHRLEEERLENERIQALHLERKELSLPYFKFWSEFEKQLNFGEVSDSDFNNFLNRIKKEFIEDEKKQEAIRIENQRLKNEAEEREAKAKAERKEQAEKEAKLKAEQDAKFKAEQDARLKLEKELEAKNKAEEEAKKAEADRIESELKQGDEDKLNGLINSLTKLKTKYTFKSATNKKKMDDVSQLIDKVINHIKA